MKKVAPISVAIATLDRPEALRRCLDALLDGEVLPAQVIVVDQGKAMGRIARSPDTLRGR